jgi:hydroxymethylbilane synthase
MSSRRFIIGSRGSDLALYQAGLIRNLLISQQRVDAAIQIIKTAGDRIDDVAFDQMEGKGFFTKELEDSLLNRTIDLAVHSLKDLMTTQPPGLKLGAVGFRVDQRELLLIRPDAYSGAGLLPVTAGSIIGTSAARRKAQIAFHNPELVIRDLRGNVPTRIQKLREGRYDAIVIALAGVTRLGLDISDLRAVPLDPEQFLPAPAQGILGIQIRDDDDPVERVVSQLGSIEAAQCAELERGLLLRFGGGCSLPLGVYSQINGPVMQLRAVLGVHDGSHWVGIRRADVSGTDIPHILDQAHAELSEGTVCRV